MFRLVVISVLASIATVQCGTILAPVVGKLVSEKVVEAHGSNVVHPSSQLVAAISPAGLRYADVALLQQQPVAEIAQPVAKASLVAEKTIEAHGHQVIHDARPLIALAKPLAVESHVAIPAITARDVIPYATPIYYSGYPHQLVAEKTVSSYGHTVHHV
ncbi:uncharacterized protein LOC143897463 [Temnothorax americanus]|uniref:uncharacterized protein LOC143897463 n=1 Tax=Temnothorax americanus TaxID=1964332 RepID=UPI004067AB48